MFLKQGSQYNFYVGIDIEMILTYKKWVIVNSPSESFEIFYIPTENS